MTIPLTAASITLTPISATNGYCMLPTNTVEIVNETSLILHIIQPSELSKILNNIQENIVTLSIDTKQHLKTQIETIKAKIGSITPNNKRQKRGILNIVGDAQKWLFGTMNDDDRQQIEQRLTTNQINNLQTINTINKQVEINTNFNESITVLKNTILDDRNKILNFINNIQTHNNDINTRLTYHDQLLKLQYLENKVDEILDNIASAKYNTLHPSILTAEEINKYQIDFLKIKLSRVGVMIYNGSIILAIKLPINTIQITQYTIIPITNKKHLKIDETIEKIVKIQNKTYSFAENKMLNELKLSNNCIVNNNCKLIEDFDTKIEVVNDGTLLIQNSETISINAKCNEKETTYTILNNTLIEFVNCTITFKEKQYSNKQNIYIEKYYEDKTNINYNFTSKPSFKEIIIKEVENIKEIRELKIRNIISDTSLIAIIIILSITVIYGYIKINRIQENPISKGGGVTYSP